MFVWDKWECPRGGVSLRLCMDSWTDPLKIVLSGQLRLASWLTESLKIYGNEYL